VTSYVYPEPLRHPQIKHECSHFVDHLPSLKRIPARDRKDFAASVRIEAS